MPLTHANILTNIGDVLDVVPLDDRDVLIGMLPPFHSFGLSIPTIVPLCTGLRTVYHPNPTEAALLARVIETYRASILVGTPAFVGGIVRAARPSQLATLRLAVTGAEKCPPAIHEAVRARCPGATILEGYGITECSPVVSANWPGQVFPGSIGRLMPSVEGLVVHHETGAPLPPDETGMLLVRGPSVFAGYLNHDGESPFVTVGGHTWYRTGDLVRRDADGVLWFEGRLKRFVKMGGEMISLAAIESALLPHLTSPDDEGPSIAVDAAGSPDNPEVVLYSLREVDRDSVNSFLRSAGFSPLYYVRRVVRVRSIPILGTGKTDYRGLATQPSC